MLCFHYMVWFIFQLILQYIDWFLCYNSFKWDYVGFAHWNCILRCDTSFEINCKDIVRHIVFLATIFTFNGVYKFTWVSYSTKDISTYLVSTIQFMCIYFHRIIFLSILLNGVIDVRHRNQRICGLKIPPKSLPAGRIFRSTVIVKSCFQNFRA